MCSIVASFSIDKIKELIELNRYRGEFSHSITYIDYNEPMRVLHIERALGKLDANKIDPPNQVNSIYTIVHQQAPTIETSEKCIHPAEYGGLLWHNGILKPETINELVLRHQNTFTFLPSFALEYTYWDTYLLAMDLYNRGIPIDIDGSFACLWWHQKKLYAFRNEISPLFMDKDFTFSSTKFNGSYPVQANHVLELDLNKKLFKSVGQFNTVDNPFEGIS